MKFEVGAYYKRTYGGGYYNIFYIDSSSTAILVYSSDFSTKNKKVQIDGFISNVPTHKMTSKEINLMLAKLL